MFPRTLVGGVSLPRMIIGTNWFLGYSHCTLAKDQFIKDFNANRARIADIMEVFVNAGVDAVIGFIANDPLYEAVQEVQQRTGKPITVISTPGFPIEAEHLEKGLDYDAIQRILDVDAARGATFCFPHTGTTDRLLDKLTRQIRFGPELCRLIRERGMIPGLSTHMPEAIVYADETGLDVETYISIYNSMGFLMPIEVDWVHSIIQQAKKPVLTIKPMAAGQVRPLQGLAFSWTTIRPQDMVAVGTMTPAEAQELIDISLRILEGQEKQIKLQGTRSKETVKAK
jgi:hypothetical protein